MVHVRAVCTQLDGRLAMIDTRSQRLSTFPQAQLEHGRLLPRT